MNNETTTGHAKENRTRAFTLVEIMILVIIIGMMATMAMPHLAKARESSQNVRLMNDWRVFKAAFESYATETGEFPGEGTAGQIPMGMEEHLGEAWIVVTAVGGSWDWDFEQFGFTAGISLLDSSMVAGQMRNVDAQLDDGDLANGLFRQTGATRFTYILEL